MQRLAYSELRRWKDDPDRKPLLVEGVRQCGKTYLLKEFGKREFESVVYVNLEKTGSLNDVFEGDLDPSAIIRSLEIMYGRPIESGRTLLILDEIQAVPRALTSLKYFAEEMPDLHIACAGSLLGLITSKPESFPVGKVDRLKLYPMSFPEFLLANGEMSLSSYVLSRKEDETVPQPLHDALVRYLREYYLVGGMPAAVSSWVDHHNVSAVTRILRGIIRDYQEDFSKHAGGELQNVILVWDSIPVQIARENQRFMFGHAKHGSRARDLENALTWLVDAGLVYKVCSVKAPALPLKNVSDRTSFKLYAFDVGVFRVMSGKGGEVMGGGTSIDHLFRGALTENYVLSQMLSGGAEEVFYWRGDRKEVDFLIDGQNGPVPIEVKSESNYDADSLESYIGSYGPDDAFVASMRRGGRGRYTTVPLYCSMMIPSYCGIGSVIKTGEIYIEPMTADDGRMRFVSSDWSRSGDRYIMTVHSNGSATGPVRVFRRDGDTYREVPVMKIVDLYGNVTVESESPFEGFMTVGGGM